MAQNASEEFQREAGLEDRTTALLDPEASNHLGPEDRVTCLKIGYVLIQSAVDNDDGTLAKAAVTVFRLALQRMPDDPSLLNGLGQSLVELGRLASAAEASSALAEAAHAFVAASAELTRQTQPSTTQRVRYAINHAMTLWLLAEQTADRTKAKEAVSIIQGLIKRKELPPATFYWAHAQNILGNALMLVDSHSEAVLAFLEALGSSSDPIDKARVLNNLATAYAEQGKYTAAKNAYNEALEQQPIVRVLWSRIQHNRGAALLQEALADEKSPKVETLLHQAIDAFRAALDERPRARSQRDWAETTAKLATAMSILGAKLYSPRNVQSKQAAINHVLESLNLYAECILELPAQRITDSLTHFLLAIILLAKLSNTVISLRLNLRRFLYDFMSILVSKHIFENFNSATEYFNFVRRILRSLHDPLLLFDVRDRSHILHALRAFLNDHGIPPKDWPEIFADLTTTPGTGDLQSAAQITTGRMKSERPLPELPPELSQPSPKSTSKPAAPEETVVNSVRAPAPPSIALPKPPPGMEWPTEKFAESRWYRKHGGIIEFFRNTSWSDIFSAGHFITQQTLRSVDDKAWLAIKGYKRSKTLPPDIRILTDDDLEKNLAEGRIRATFAAPTP